VGSDSREQIVEEEEKASAGQDHDAGHGTHPFEDDPSVFAEPDAGKSGVTVAA
jgi:hypothetical protein